MKLKKLIVLVACVCGFLTPRNNRAQDVVTYLDNTGQPIAGSMGLGLGYGSVGAQFQTGTNGGGYFLDSIQLQFADATGSPMFSGLGVVLCSDYFDGPGNPVSFLDASQNPLTSGLYTYTPRTDAILESNTKYWLIVGVTSILGGSAYNVSYTSTTMASSPDDWTITGITAIGQAGIPIFSIDAISVPEPSVFALLVTAFPIISGGKYWRRTRSLW